MSRYQINERIKNRYLVYRVLQGGLGEVYLCYDMESECHPIALKTFQSDPFDKEKTRRLYLSLHKESVVWNIIGEHPNIVRCFYTDLVDNRIFLFLELIENNISDGSSLRDLLQTEQINPENALTIILDICRGLDYAGQQQPGIVHRDLKPENVLIDENGVAKITDFGLAKTFGETDFSPFRKTENPAKFQSFLTTASDSKSNCIAGTPLYMSPEQWRGLSLDSRSDIYAIGCILYEILAGGFAYDGDLSELENLHTFGAVPQLPNNGDFNSKINIVLRKCLAKDVNERFQTVSQLFKALVKIYQNQFGKKPRLPEFKYSTGKKDYTNMGVTLSRAGLHEQALKYHNLAIEADSLDPRFYVNRGITLESLGEQKSALADFNKAVILSPLYARAYYHRGIILYKANMYEEAKTDFLRAILLQPDFALAYTNLGQTLFIMGNLNDALIYHERALEIDPTLVPAYNQRGYALTKLNRTAEAEQDFLQAHDLDPTDCASHIHLGYLYESQGKYLKAVECFEVAAKLGFSQATILAKKARINYLNY